MTHAPDPAWGGRHFTDAEAKAFLDLAELHGFRSEAEELVRANLRGAMTMDGARTRLIVLAGGETLGEMPPPPELGSAIEPQPSAQGDPSAQPKGMVQIEPLR